MMTLTPSDTELYRAHAAELMRYATVLVGPDDAPDVVSDAVLSAFTSRAWSEVRQPRAYLFRAVLNAANSRHRSQGRRERREQTVALRSVAPAEPAHDSHLDVRGALGVLTPQQRAVVYLTYWDDLAVADIASLLGVGEGTVKKQLARARDRLRKVIDHG